MSRIGQPPIQPPPSFDIHQPEVENHADGRPTVAPQDSRISGRPPPRATAAPSSKFFIKQECLNPYTREIEAMIGAVRGRDKLLVNINGEDIEMIKVPASGGDNTRKSLYVPREELRLHGGVHQPSQTTEPALSESSFEQIKKKIQQSVADHFGHDLEALKNVGDEGGVSPGHRCIGMVAHYAWQALQGEGVPLSDPRSTQALKASVDSAISVAEKWDDAQPFNARSLVVFEALRGHMSQVKAHESFELLLSEKFAGTPFEQIAPNNRSLMCVDPCKVIPLEQKLEEILKAQGNTPPGADISGRNPFMGLLFNKEANYLGDMGKGWLSIMNSLRDKTVNPSYDFIVDLHKTAAGSTTGSGKAGVPANFFLIPGGNLSPAGQQETSQFIEKLRQDYGIDISFKFAYKEHGKDIYAIRRGEVHTDTVKNLVNTWIDEYQAASKSADSQPMAEKSDAKVLAAIDLCQKLERFHVFQDGNCRTFGVLLLNYLLAKEGEPLTLLDNPNKIDGFSRQEMLQLVREGQARVKEMEQQT